jgi:SAM-dependent methyltransferase
MFFTKAILLLAICLVTFGAVTLKNAPLQNPAHGATTLSQSVSAQEPQTATPKREPDVPYVPTPHEVVAEMLRLANVTKSDVVYDLGCGDGRIVIAAAQKYGARGVGIDINPQRIIEAQANAKAAGVADRVQFMEQDLFDTDLNQATVITLYLLPQVNLKLRPKLLNLKPGTRIVSHSFDMGDWKPEQTVNVNGRTVYYWTIPNNARSQKPARR